MSNANHLEILRSGREAWKNWRAERKRRPNLSGAKLAGEDFSSYDLTDTDLRGANLFRTRLRRAKLNGADLSGAAARFLYLSGAKLVGAKLVGADLRATSLRGADLTGADFSSAILRFASLVGAKVEGARFTGAEVYGISAWNLKGEPADQQGLVIREKDQPGIVTTTIDDLDTAQYLALLRENAKIADIIKTASERTVLLLGRFTPARKKVLDALKAHLLDRNFVPLLFDFNRTESRDLTETVAILAHMACFVIPDLTGAKSVPQELSFIVPFLPSVPVVPVLSEKDERVYSMFEHFLRYPWVKKPVTYRDLDHLLSIVDRKVIEVGYKSAMKLRGVAAPRLPPRPKGKSRTKARPKKMAARRKRA